MKSPTEVAGRHTLETKTTVLSLDEPCLYYAELAKQSEDYTGLHRYAMVWVIRNDEVFQADLDMGPIAGVEEPGLTIYPNHEAGETVGQVIDIANEARANGSLDKFREFEPPALTDGYQSIMEEKERHVRRYKESQNIRSMDEYARLQEV